jgi:hypothetical protein
MANSYVGKLNPIQAERAARAGLSEKSVPDAIAAMSAAGEIPKGKTFVEQDTVDANGTRTQLYFNKPKNKWVYQVTRKGGPNNRLEANTKEQLLADIATDAKQVANDNDPDVVAARTWMQQSKWGKEFSTFQCKNAWAMLDDALAEMGLPVTAENLDKAFVEILDRDDVATNWHRFEQKRDRLASEVPARGQRRQAPSPHESTSRTNEVRKAEDKANRNVPIKELRRRAIFGGKVETSPSRGTVLHRQ